MEGIDGELTCGICLEFFDTPLLLPCGHNFCRRCIQGVIENNNPFYGLPSMGMTSTYKCPLCQQSFSSRNKSVDNLPRNKALESIIDHCKSASPVDIYDTGWNSELPIRFRMCPRHQLPMESYCRSCNLSACQKCEREHHEGQDMKLRHKLHSLKDVAYKHQAEIAESLTEIKKQSINLYARLSLLKNIEEEIQQNETHLMKELDQHINMIMSAVRGQHEALKQQLQNNFIEIKKPVTDELRRCNSLKTSIQELMKKVSEIKRTTDTGLRIALMGGAKKQLTSLLCFDIAWSIKDQSIPMVELPSWRLNIQKVLDSISNVDWTKADVKEKSAACQTDETETMKNSTLKSPSQPPLVADTKESLITNTADSSRRRSKVDNKTEDIGTDPQKLNVCDISNAHSSIETRGQASGTEGTTLGIDITKKEKDDIYKRSNESKQPKMVEPDSSQPDLNANNACVTDYSKIQGMNSEANGNEHTHQSKLEASGNEQTHHTESEASGNVQTQQSKTDVLPKKTYKDLDLAHSVQYDDSRFKEFLGVVKSKTSVSGTLTGEKGGNITEPRTAKTLQSFGRSEFSNVDEQDNPTAKAPAVTSSTARLSVADLSLRKYLDSQGLNVNEALTVMNSGRNKTSKSSDTTDKVKEDVDSTGARPKIMLCQKKSVEGKETTNNKETSRDTSNVSEMINLSDPDDGNDKNDDEFLCQSLNRFSFHPKPEVSEDHRKSFPPDPCQSRKFSFQMPFMRKSGKPKAKISPHRDAVAQFVARRRTGSPHIPKTSSSGNLQKKTCRESVNDLPKPSSSPALSEMDEIRTRRVHVIHRTPVQFLGSNTNGYLFSEKLSPTNLDLKSGSSTTDEEKNSSEGLFKATDRKIIRGKRFGVKK